MNPTTTPPVPSSFFSFLSSSPCLYVSQEGGGGRGEHVSTERNRSNFFPLENFHQNRPDFDVSPLLFSSSWEKIEGEGQTGSAVARVHGFLETSYRIPRTLKETARISFQRFSMSRFWKAASIEATGKNSTRLKRLIVPGIDFDGLLIPSPFSFSLFIFPIVPMCHFHATNPVLFLRDCRFRFQISPINRINLLRSSSIY